MSSAPSSPTPPTGAIITPCGRSDMLKFIGKRLALLPLVMFGVTVLLFGLLQFLSPEMRASLYVKDPRQLSALESVIQKYHLRDPMPVQYWVWLKQVLRGDLGYSETAKLPVS